jgi:hypothetical protein
VSQDSEKVNPSENQEGGAKAYLILKIILATRYRCRFSRRLSGVVRLPETLDENVRWALETASAVTSVAPDRAIISFLIGL